MILTEASSLGQGLDHCNRCGECCKDPCLFNATGDVERIGAHLGLSAPDMLKRLRVVKDAHGNIMVSPQRAGDYCEFYEDGCSIHEVKPAGGRDFECWNSERTDPGRASAFFWQEADIERTLKLQGT